MSLCALSHGTSFDTVPCVRHAQFFGYHRCSYSEFDDKLNVVASAGRAGVAAFKLGPFGEERRWFLDELRAGRPSSKTVTQMRVQMR